MTPLTPLTSKRARADEAERARASEALHNGALGLIHACVVPVAQRDEHVETLRRAAADASEAEYQARSRRDAQELVVQLLQEKTEEAKLDMRQTDYMTASRRPTLRAESTNVRVRGARMSACA